MRFALRITSVLIPVFTFACGADTGGGEGSSENDVSSEADDPSEAGSMTGSEDGAPGGSTAPSSGETTGSEPTSSSPGAEPSLPVAPPTGNPVVPEPGEEPDVGPVGSDPSVDAEPSPDPCAERPVCRLACGEGTENPIDEDGCRDSCSCVPIEAEPEAPAEPEPAEPSPGEPEPAVEPEPSACPPFAPCTVLCAAGTAFPVDENGCTTSCQCVPAMTPDPILCGTVGTWCDPLLSVGVAMTAPPNCCEGLVCLPGLCTNASPPGCSYGCAAASDADPCGGCEDGEVCIFQVVESAPGQSYYTCATESPQPCNVDDACGCIVGQGECSYSIDEEICRCASSAE